MKLGLEKLVELHRKPQLVYDVGGYLGNYTKEILNRFDCKVVLFEPIKEYVEICRNKFATNPNVTVVPMAVWGDGAGTLMYKNGQSSSQFKDWAKSAEMEYVETVKLSDYINISGIPEILKLNCEGAEYEILNDIKQEGFLPQINELLIQFHKIDNWKKRYESIKEDIVKTHRFIYSFKSWYLWQKSS